MRSWIASLTWFFAGAITRTILNDLTRRYEEEGELRFAGPGLLRPFVSILRNGRNKHFPGGLDNPSDEDDIIGLFPRSHGR